MDYLVHHGIKGQKWGIRRYQNPDGTLTDAGKKRLERFKKSRSGIAEKQINRFLERSTERYKKNPTKRNADRLEKAKIAKDYWDRQTKNMTIEDTLNFDDRFSGNSLAQYNNAYYTIQAVKSLRLSELNDDTIKKGALDIRIKREMDQFMDEMRREMLVQHIHNQF